MRTVVTERLPGSLVLCGSLRKATSAKVTMARQGGSVGINGHLEESGERGSMVR